MDTDSGALGAQAMEMLAGVEALEEAGESDGQTKMIRTTDESGGQHQPPHHTGFSGARLVLPPSTAFPQRGFCLLHKFSASGAASASHH